MSRSAAIALDVGSVTAKVAVAGSEGALRRSSVAASPGSRRVALSAALAAVRTDLGGDPDSVCFAVPDVWLSADPAGGRAFEDFRYLAENGLGLGGASWTGHAVAVTAAATGRWPAAGDGRYLICDIGASGVRTAVCAVAGQQVALVTSAAAAGYGAAHFVANATSAAGAQGDPGLGDWLPAIRDQPRLVVALERAAVDPAFLETRACTLTGAAGSYSLTAGQLTDSFAPVAQALRAGVLELLDGEPPTVAVLTGGLGWFPLAAHAVAAAAGVTPKVADTDTAAVGALLLHRGSMRQAPVSLPPVKLPVHQVRNGLLEEERLDLPWSRSFAPLDGEPITCESDQVGLDIAGKPYLVRLPGLRPGRYQIGVRPAHPGRGLLVLRAAGSPSRNAVHISVLELDRAP